MMSEITIRLVDAALDRPAPYVKVALETETDDGGWRPLARGVTNDEGRVAFARPPVPAASRHLPAACLRHRLSCDIGVYLARAGAASPFPELQVHFVDDGRGAAPRLRVDLRPDGYGVTREA